MLCWKWISSLKPSRNLLNKVILTTTLNETYFDRTLITQKDHQLSLICVLCSDAAYELIRGRTCAPVNICRLDEQTLKPLYTCLHVLYDQVPLAGHYGLISTYWINFPPDNCLHCGYDYQIILSRYNGSVCRKYLPIHLFCGVCSGRKN